jgi:LysR family cyn operon transcriptional activator
LPGVDVRLIEGNSAVLLELIRQGQLHLALTTYAPELRRAARLVGALPLFAIGKEERGEVEDSLEVNALEDIPLLLLRRGFGSRDLFDAACQVAHIRPNIFLESDASGALLSLARAGCGVAVLPATVSLLGQGLTVRKLVQEGVALEFRIAVHWNPQRFLPPYAERFAEELCDHAAKEYASVAAARAERSALASR